MIHFCILVFITLILLTLKAYFDVERQKMGLWVSHSFEWIGLAIIITCISLPFSYNWHDIKISIAELIILIPIAWIYFDICHNYFADEKLDYISPLSPHQSLSDRFLTWIGVKWQYYIKGLCLLLAIGIDYLLLK